MTRLTGKHIHSRLFSDPKKYCVRHDGHADGGEWKTSKDGLRRQFVCLNCIQNEKNRTILHAAKHESLWISESQSSTSEALPQDRALVRDR